MVQICLTWTHQLVTYKKKKHWTKTEWKQYKIKKQKQTKPHNIHVGPFLTISMGKIKVKM